MGSASALATRLGLPVRNLALLGQALLHGSFTNEHPDSPVGSNQRLEFLGDTVVSLIVSEALFDHHPDEDEGALTARRAAIVSTTGLARLATRIKLGELVVLGQGAERTGERSRASVLAAAFEAVVGALYLDLGLDSVRGWLLALVVDDIDTTQPLTALKSPKSRLQELSYKHTGHPPVYRLLEMSGPDHARRYRVEALVAGESLGTGEGNSRRAAESAAAAQAVEMLLARGEAPGGAPSEHAAEVDTVGPSGAT